VQLCFIGRNAVLVALCGENAPRRGRESHSVARVRFGWTPSASRVSRRGRARRNPASRRPRAEARAGSQPRR